MLLACGEKIKSETQNLHEPSWWEVTGLGIIPSWNPVSLTVGLSSDVKQSFKLFSLFFFLCLQWSWNTDNKLALHIRLLVAHPQSPLSWLLLHIYSIVYSPLFVSPGKILCQSASLQNFIYSCHAKTLQAAGLKLTNQTTNNSDYKFNMHCKVF